MYLAFENFYGADWTVAQLPPRSAILQGGLEGRSFSYFFLSAMHLRTIVQVQSLLTPYGKSVAQVGLLGMALAAVLLPLLWGRLGTRGAR